LSDVAVLVGLEMYLFALADFLRLNWYLSSPVGLYQNMSDCGGSTW